MSSFGFASIHSKTGGTPAIVDFGYAIDWEHSPVDMVKYAMGKKKDYNPIDQKKKWGLETMGERYHALFETIKGQAYDV